MKKILLMAFLGMVAFSCENELRSDDLRSANVESIKSSESTFRVYGEADNIANRLNQINDEFTTLFFDLGIVGLIQSESENGITFNFRTEKTFIFKGNKYNGNDFQFYITDNTLTLTKSNLKIKYFDGIPHLLKDNQIFNLETLNPSQVGNDIQSIFLVLVFDEIMGSNIKSNFESYRLNSAGPCAWWNTHTVMGIGSTSDAAQADLYYATIQAANDGSLMGCTSIGGVTETNLGFMKIRRQAFCCP